MKHIAIVLAAGRGKRMNSKVAKQYLLLQDKPVLYYALQQFEHSFVDHIILVTASDEIDYCSREIVARFHFSKVCDIVAGGKERYHSVRQGLVAAGKLLSQDKDGSLEDACVYIHDGARPFITEEILIRARNSVEQYGSGVVAMPVKDTIKIADEEGFAVSTPKRSLVWQMQTPQCFRYADIRTGYDRLITEEAALLSQGISITDDAMVMELFGHDRIKLVEGSYHNIKITTPEDLQIAEGFLDNHHDKI